MIHLVTPCHRLNNLPLILESIVRELTGLDWQWWTVVDARMARSPGAALDSRQRILNGFPRDVTFGAGFLRNLALRQIDSGWIYDLDDDTILHPNFRKLFDRVPAGKQVFWFDQVDKSGLRICGPGGPYGTGMGAIRREAIVKEWIPDRYDTDQDYYGIHLKAIPLERQDLFVEPGAFYNYLR